MAHALGPLTRNTDLPSYFAPLLEAGGHPVCEVIPSFGGVDFDMQDNALRIMATWNACLDVDTSDLWPGMVREMREALEAVERIFDQGTDNTTIDQWDEAYGKVQNVLHKAREEEVMPGSP